MTNNPDFDLHKKYYNYEIVICHSGRAVFESETAPYNVHTMRLEN